MPSNRRRNPLTTIPHDPTITPDPSLVRAVTGDSWDLPLPDSSVPCIVTSPPYNLDMPYPKTSDLRPWRAYWRDVARTCEEWWRVIQPGGRVWVVCQVTANELPRTPEQQKDKARAPSSRSDALGIRRVPLLGGWLTHLLQAGFAYRDVIAWRQDGFSGGCAWGSWRQPTAPNVRGEWESIIWVYKPNDDGGFRREPPGIFAHKAKASGVKSWQDDHDHLGGVWTDLVRNVWVVRPSSSAYPATYPPEIPARCIRLSTWPGEVVVDPYAGSGTTGWVAAKLGRKAVMVDRGPVRFDVSPGRGWEGTPIPDDGDEAEDSTTTP